ncbi:MAG TPA: hypothetical protein VFA92_07925, partial [Candidatus Binatia bacterium]|nr:hypothetical protein [Candidatus Binatia bacterium]
MARGAQALSLSDVSLPTSGLPRDELVTLAAELDGAGFAALEVLDGERYRACLEAGQDPWEELRAIRAAAPNTPLRAALRGQSLTGERHVADDAVELFLRQAADCGVDVFRVFDPLDDPRNLRTAIAAARGLGRRVEGALCFAVGPVHDLDRWRDAAGRLAELGVDALAIRDTSGLLTPLTARELVRALRETQFLRRFDLVEMREVLARRPCRRLRVLIEDLVLTQSGIEDDLLAICDRHG